MSKKSREPDTASGVGVATVGWVGVSTRLAIPFLASAGPPPAVGTLSFDAPIWKYWTIRFVTFTVHVDANGRVNSIER